MKIIFILLSLIAPAFASIISIDMNPGSAAYNGIGVLDTTARTWTGFNTTSKTLNFSISGSNATLTATGAYSAGAFGSHTLAAFNDYGFFGNAPAAPHYLTFTGLNASISYDIVVLAARFYTSFNGASLTLTQGTAGDGVITRTTTPTQLSTLVENNNYVRFQSITPDSSGRIQFSAPAFNFVNALEIQAVPEVSTTTLSIGCLALGVWVRRRRQGVATDR